MVRFLYCGSDVLAILFYGVIRNGVNFLALTNSKIYGTLKFISEGKNHRELQ